MDIDGAINSSLMPALMKKYYPTSPTVTSLILTVPAISPRASAWVCLVAPAGFKVLIASIPSPGDRAEGDRGPTRRRSQQCSNLGWREQGISEVAFSKEYKAEYQMEHLH